jgi:hypothetical protein
VEDIAAWFLRYLPGPLRTLGRSVAQHIADYGMRIAKRILGFFHFIGVPFERVYTAAHNLRYALSGFMGQAYYAIRWVKDVWIPRMVNTARAQIIAWANTAIAVARNAVLAAVSTVERWARNAVAVVTAFVNTVQRWAQAELNRIWGAIPAPIRNAWLMLLHPDRLATWAVGAMWKAFLRLAEGNAERIGLWLLRSSPAMSLSIARIVERVIARIL